MHTDCTQHPRRGKGSSLETVGSRGSRWRRLFIAVLVSGCVQGPTVMAEPVAEPPVSGVESVVPALSGDGVLTLEAFLWMVIDRHEEVEAERLGVDVARRQYKAALGKYEPSLTLSAEREYNHMRTTIEEALNLGFELTAEERDFKEQNNLLRASIDGLTPLGGTYSISANIDDLDNNLNTSIDGEQANEYKSFMGIELTQPLLKNFGPNVTNADIRLARGSAALESEKYREYLLGTTAKAIQLYWQCYAAEQKLEMRQRSREIAENLYKVNKKRYAAGKIDYTDVLDAEAGMRLREALVAAAEQSLLTAKRSMLSLVDPEGQYRPEDIHVAATLPPASEIEFVYDETLDLVYADNPGYLQAVRQVEQEKLRENYAENQRLPQLDLTASYGLNGMDDEWHDSWSTAFERDYTSWAVKAELTVPMLGGLREGNEKHAARLKRLQAEKRLEAEKRQLANDLDVVAQLVERVREQAENYQRVVATSSELLRTEEVRFRQGKSDIRELLDREVGVLKARESLLDTRLAHQYALVNLYSLDGTLLSKYGIDKPGAAEH